MAQFDANINLRVKVSEAEKALKSFERQVQKLEKRQLFKGEDKGAQVGQRLLRQQVQASKEAVRTADARVEKELRITAALQRQETLLKAINRAGGPNSAAARGRIDDAVAASKEAKKNLGIQNAVNTLLEKELQIRREINRTRLAADEARSVGRTRGGSIEGLAGRGGQASKIAELVKLNKLYVTAAEKGETDIAKAIDRRYKRKFALVERDIQKTEAATKRALDLEKQRTREAQKRTKAIIAANRAEQQGSKKGNRLESLALGIGFPLLFGGGVGSILGGAAGSFLGDGFGGQILLSALGQVLDDAAKAAGEFAKQATKASTSIDQLITAFGIAGTQTASRSRFAEALGIGGAARAAQAGTLETIVGQQGIKNLEELGRSAEDAGNALNRFGAATSNFFAPLLTSLNDAIANIFGGISKVEQARRLQDNPPDRSVPAGPGSAARQEFQRAAGARDAALQSNPEVKAQLELEEKINKVVQDRIDLARDAANLEARRLTSRRDVAAADRGSLEVQAQQNKLAVLEIQLQGQLEDSKRRELELERDLTKEAKRQAEEARANAIIEAERQITRDVSSQNQAAAQAYSESLSITQQLADLGQSQVASYQQQQDLLQNQSTIQMALLAERREMELLGVTELELVDAINKKYFQLEEQEKRRLALQQERLRQELIMFRYREQELIDNRELAKLEAARSAAAQIRDMDFARDFELTGQGFGFFGDSEIFKDKRLAETAAQLESYNEQIGKLQARINTLNNEGVDPDKIFPLEQNLRNLIQVRDSYQELQPAIDAAAIAQARFNDAFNLVNPIMQNLVNNLAEVVKGTMSVEEAFANMLDSIGKMLAQKGAEMIAQYIAIGIARAFAGIGSSTPTIGTDTNYFGQGFTPMDYFRADGGPVNANRPYMVGERGPELFVPSSPGAVVTSEQSRAQLDMYSPGNAVDAPAGPMNVNMNYSGPTMAFDDKRYVPVEAIPGIIKDAAKQGEQRTLASMRNRVSTRNRVGI